MSEDLLTQQVPQQSGSYAGAGFITGAAVGGAAGAAAAHYKDLGFIKTKPDLDKVFSQEPDTFTSKIEKAEGDNKTFLEKAKTYAEEIKAKAEAFDAKEKEIKEAIPDIAEADLKAKLEEAGFKGTKEETLNVIKDKAKTEIKDLAEKAKFAGKTWNGLLAAGVLGLLGLAIGASIKKD